MGMPRGSILYYMTFHAEKRAFLIQRRGQQLELQKLKFVHKQETVQETGWDVNVKYYFLHLNYLPRKHKQKNRKVARPTPEVFAYISIYYIITNILVLTFVNISVIICKYQY